ncbi:hypothetical protein H6F32_06365 [Anabaena sp. FACHB-1237]|uniref:T3SS effector HopA1 family protein n=1 Tax=Anabaena sp. FACHB-1237 TaxID=2692769 RepID=UPI001680E8FD|nr:T3SS effector HopA1 family protein [Anabaena sp. FACHB-1237]MBD2137216.1 hypothetical protein [Anabaena sp. FACHB-1237]
MQVIYSQTIQTSQFSKLPKQLKISLEDIVNYVEIESYSVFKHLRYKSRELPASVIARFQDLPLQVQEKHLSLQLRNFIYGTYYHNSWQDTEISEVTTEEKLTNDNLFGMDLGFYERLHKNNQGEGYWSPNWLVINEESDGCLLVKRNGLTLHIQRDVYLSDRDKNAIVGELVAIKMPKNLVQNAFYMAVSNQGTQGDKNIARVYFNVTPEGAISMMKSLTQLLNYLQIPFSFKALYSPDNYKRYDAGVLYFNKYNYPLIHEVLKRVYSENKDYFLPEVPLFTKQLAPGLGCAEEPENKFTEQESFGTHRCQMIANGLINSWHKGDNSPESRIMSIFEQFASQKIKLESAYLNAYSDDIYTPLE